MARVILATSAPPRFLGAHVGESLRDLTSELPEDTVQ